MNHSLLGQKIKTLFSSIVDNNRDKMLVANNHNRANILRNLSDEYQAAIIDPIDPSKQIIANLVVKYHLQGGVAERPLTLIINSDQELPNLTANQDEHIFETIKNTIVNMHNGFNNVVNNSIDNINNGLNASGAVLDIADVTISSLSYAGASIGSALPIASTALGLTNGATSLVVNLTSNNKDGIVSSVVNISYALANTAVGIANPPAGLVMSAVGAAMSIQSLNLFGTNS
jgi:hypothetical protein